MTYESGAVRRFLSLFVFAISESAVGNLATPRATLSYCQSLQ
jgi:hypothetical protein